MKQIWIKFRFFGAEISMTVGVALLLLSLAMMAASWLARSR